MVVKNCLDEYFRLMAERPELFLPSEVISIVTDREVLENFSVEKGVTLGVVYKSRFNCLVVDLVRCEDRYFPYERIIPTADGRGVICVPVYEGRFVLLRQFRHAIRAEQISFPRGFGENGLESSENAKKELFEEIGAYASRIVKLGELAPDSGLSSSVCDIFLCYIDGFKNNNVEGITDVICLSFEELKKKIAANDINDGFTLCAFSLLEGKGIDIAQ